MHIRLALPCLTASLFAVMASAQTATTERFELSGSIVTLNILPFLQAEELDTLRFVGQSQEALALFIPDGGGYAAMALAPADGFVRDGVPADSAIAMSGLPDAAAARAAALRECNATRSGGPACVVAMEIAPK
jgi:hypothetical protein